MNQQAINPVVSVIIPAYNAESTLSETLLSILAQTYQNWEVIVVDDGSSDATTSVVTEYSAVDQRVRLLTQSNEGPSAARNHGVMKSRGEIIAFLDADDTWSPRHLELALDLLAEDAELGVAFAPCAIVDESGNDTGQRTRPSLSNVTAADILASNPTATCSSLVLRKSVFSASGFMREDMAYAEDQEWLFRVVVSGWHCRSHGEHTVNYRCNPNGLSSDVPRMHAGWKMFIRLARRHAPEIVDQHLGPATASINLYYVRRLLRDGNYGLQTMQHFLAAWYAAPARACRLSVRLLASVGLSSLKNGLRPLRAMLSSSEKATA